eukprot:scaffold1467_cov30-Tisochrysis_lutea.AAC.5
MSARSFEPRSRWRDAADGAISQANSRRSLSAQISSTSPVQRERAWCNEQSRQTSRAGSAANSASSR